MFMNEYDCSLIIIHDQLRSLMIINYHSLSLIIIIHPLIMINYHSLSFMIINFY